MKKFIAIVSFLLIFTSMLCGCKKDVVTPSANVPVVSESPAIPSPAISPAAESPGAASPEATAPVKPTASAAAESPTNS